jgi:hypothetical protein
VHERELSLRGILAGGLLIGAGIAASVLGAWLLIGHLGAPAAGPNGSPPARIGAPALQTVPHQDLQAYLREKRARLESSGPVPGEPGRMHIPIEQAMQILAQRNRR